MIIVTYLTYKYLINDISKQDARMYFRLYLFELTFDVCKVSILLTLHGTFHFLCPLSQLFGCSAAAQVKTSRETKGQFLSVNMAFSVGVMSAMYLTKGITGKKWEI